MKEATLKDLIMETGYRGSDRIHVAPNIPPKTLRNAIASYGRDLADKDVLILIDDTVFRGGRRGAIVTETVFASHDSDGDECFVDFGIGLSFRNNKRKLYINDAFVAHFALPDDREMDKVLAVIDKHAQQVKQRIESERMSATDADPKVATSADGASEQHETRDGGHQESHTSEPDDVSRTFGIHFQRKHDDGLYVQVAALNVADGVTGVLESFFNVREKKDAVISQLQGAVWRCLKGYRKLIIERHNLYELKNDAVTIEVIGGIITAFILSMVHRGVPLEVATLLVKEATRKVVEDDQLMNMIFVVMAMSVDEIGENNRPTLLHEISTNLLARVICTGITGNLDPRMDARQVLHVMGYGVEELETFYQGIHHSVDEFYDVLKHECNWVVRKSQDLLF